MKALFVQWVPPPLPVNEEVEDIEDAEDEEHDAEGDEGESSTVEEDDSLVKMEVSDVFFSTLRVDDEEPSGR